MSSADTQRPLRILHVLSKLERDWRGGIGRVVTGAARAMTARGHDVHLAGRARDGEGVETVPGTTIHEWPGQIGHFRQLPRLLRLQRQLQPDVVHFHSTQPHGSLVLPFLKLRRFVGNPRVLATAHTGRSEPPSPLSRAVFSRLDGVVAPTAWSAERAVAAGANPEGVYVIWSGIDAVHTRDPECERPVILAMGRMVPSKGFDILLEAFDRAAFGRPHWQLVIGGEGRELRGLRQRAEKSEHGDRIFLPGHVQGSEKERLFGEAAIAVVPSRRDMIPGVMLEFQAHGIPTVASAVGAIPEGAAGGKAARLVPPKDVHALADTLGELMDRSELRRQLAAGARETSEGRLWSRIALQLESAYRAQQTNSAKASEVKESAQARARA